jgi:hypothetical protein
MKSFLDTHSALISDSQHNLALGTPLPDDRDTPLSLFRSRLAPDILPARRPVIERDVLEMHGLELCRLQTEGGKKSIATLVTVGHRYQSYAG